MQKLRYVLRHGSVPFGLFFFFKKKNQLFSLFSFSLFSTLSHNNILHFSCWLRIEHNYWLTGWLSEIPLYFCDHIWVSQNPEYNKSLKWLLLCTKQCCLVLSVLHRRSWSDVCDLWKWWGDDHKVFDEKIHHKMMKGLSNSNTLV